MTTEHFVIKDGVLRWIKDMPKHPINEGDWRKSLQTAMSAFRDQSIDAYEQALQFAIDNSIEVSNQDEVKTAIYAKEYHNGETLVHITEYKFEEGRVYSLNCRVEVKQKEVPCPDGIDGCAVLHLRAVALVTFPSENNELGEAERLEDHLQERLIDFLLWVENNTYYFEDKNVTPTQVVNEYLNTMKPVTPTDNES